jgi:predicted PurR-regulated permease PerM
MNLYKATALLIVFCLILALLIVGKDFLIPIVIAFGGWFFFNAVANVLGKIKIRQRVMPLWLRYLFAGGAIVLFTFLVVQIVSANVAQLRSQVGFYEENFKNLQALLKEQLGLESVNLLSPEVMSRFDLDSIFLRLVESFSSLVGNTLLIFIYLIFLLLEQHLFGKKIQMIFTGNGARLMAVNVEKVKRTVESYILLKTLISLLTGLLSYVIMRIIGVDFALFWAFLIFLLNYIPNIGSMVATLFPALLCLVQFETLLPALIVFFGIGTVQFAVGNFLEPRIFGKSLNISGLAVILSLTFWGSVWGIIGMFLCVPITVVLLIILNSFEDTRPFAILLSDDGEI